jgi:hypothetical protein
MSFTSTCSFKPIHCKTHFLLVDSETVASVPFCDPRITFWQAPSAPRTNRFISKTGQRREARRQQDHQQLISLVRDETERVRLAVQQHIPAAPTALLASNIKFTDALDRYKELPYDYFRNWDVSAIPE